MNFQFSRRAESKRAFARLKLSLLLILALASQASSGQEEISSASFENGEKKASENRLTEDSWSAAANRSFQKETPKNLELDTQSSPIEGGTIAEAGYSQTMNAPDPAQAPTGLPAWLFTILTFLLLLSILANIYIFWSRKVLISGQMALMPEESLKQLSELKTQLKKNSAVLYKQYEEKSEELELVKCLEIGIESRDERIAQLESGFRNLVLHNHASELLELSRTVSDILAHDEVTRADLVVIQKLLDAALQALGVEKYSPQPGLDVTKLGDRISEYFEEVETENRSLDCTIAETLEVGYLVKGVSYDKVLRPARVKIYRCKEAPQ